MACRSGTEWVFVQVSGLRGWLTPCGRGRAYRVGMSESDWDRHAQMERPTHEDFERIRRIVTGFDVEMDSQSQPFLALLAEMVDPDSATHMAIQRGIRLKHATGLPVEASATVWLEGITVGVALERARLREAGN